jgi:hypothetical protein
MRGSAHKHGSVGEGETQEAQSAVMRSSAHKHGSVGAGKAQEARSAVMRSSACKRGCIGAREAQEAQCGDAQCRMRQHWLGSSSHWNMRLLEGSLKSWMTCSMLEWS